LSARLNGLRLGGDFFQTRATFIPTEGRPRTFVITGSPQRVLFEPPAASAVGLFLRRAIGQLLDERLLALALLCLAIPRRTITALLGQFSALAVSHLIAAAWVAARGSTLAGTTQDAVLVIGSAALVIAAIQNITGASTRARAAVVAVVGIASGVGLGAGVHDVVSLAGSHAGLALATFLGGVAAGGALVLVLLHSALQAPFRWRVPAWLTLAALSAVPAHEGAHIALEGMQRLRAVDLDAAGSLTRLLITGWPVLTLIGALLGLLLLAKVSGQAASRTATGGGATP
jgi:hypothetical protein